MVSSGDLGDGDTAAEKEIKQHYKIQGVIGKGSFATVRLGKHRDTGEQVAVKIMSKRKMSAEDQTAVQSEINILNSLQHPNIVQMKEHFEDEGHYCLVMELMSGGELFDCIIEKGSLSEVEANKVMVPIFDAVIAAHVQGLVHRDLKPENLLLSDKDLGVATVKISDFGLARYVCPEQSVLASTTCGTPGYVAPEILNNVKYDNRVDYWSLGVVMFIMLSGQPPFFHEDNFELFEMIKEGAYDMSGDVWNNVSACGKDLISKLLTVDRDQRLSDQNILNHPWCQGQFDPCGDGGGAAFANMQAWHAARKTSMNN